MRRRAAFVMAIIGLAFISKLKAAEGPIVAIFDIEDKGAKVKPKLLENLVDYLAARLAQEGYRVIPRQQITSRLQQQKNKSYKQCYDQACQIELGQELAAQKSLAIQLIPTGNQCEFTAVLYDLKRSTTDFAATASADCSKDDSTFEAIRKIAADFGGRLKGSQDQATTEISKFNELVDKIEKDKSYKEQTQKAWSIASRLAYDNMVARETRAEVLKRFLAEFSTDNPFEQDAKRLLRELQPAILVINTNPQDATIYLDGNFVGKTSVQLEVMAGKHRISATKYSYEEALAVIELEPGQKVDQTMVLKPIIPTKLMVRVTPPDAKLELDGKPIKASSQGVVVDRGAHVITASRVGYDPARKAIEIASGQQLEVVLDLNKIPPTTLVVKTEPAGATISIDGKAVGKSPVTKESYVGRVYIQVSLDDYEDSSTWTTLNSRQSNQVSLSLKRIIPMSPHKKWGHISFWSGVGVAAFGGIAAGQAHSAALDNKAGDLSAADKSRSWAGTSFASFGIGGALMVTGIVLWILDPGTSDSKNAMAPNIQISHGACSMTFGGRF